jgi:hypothetical protein
METLVNTNHEILSRHTGQPLEKIVADTSRDYFMSPTEAKEYGIIDAVYSASASALAVLSRLADAADGVDGIAGKGDAPAAELDRG